MILQGSFRVIDSWKGTSKDGSKPRASATLADATDGGELRLTFPDGQLPAEFVNDALVRDIKVKASTKSYGLVLAYVGLKK